MMFPFSCSAALALVLLAGCQREPVPPPQSEQQVAAEAQRKAASIEAEMNKDSASENVAKPPATQSPPPAQSPPTP